MSLRKSGLTESKKMLGSKKTLGSKKRGGATLGRPVPPILIPPKASFQSIEKTTGFQMVRHQADAFEAPFSRVDTKWVKTELKVFTDEEIYHLVAPKRTFARRQANRQPLTVEETDKALRLARIAKLAQSVFGDADRAGRWMRKPKTALSGAAPLAYLASENGARLVEDMLYRIDAGFSF
jgi:putative toxin-antitoxin system antitoxin component (TIGR02293 family)